MAAASRRTVDDIRVSNSIRRLEMLADLPSGACWKEKATIFFTVSKPMAGGPRENASLITTLMRPRSSAALQELCWSTSERNIGNRRISAWPFVLLSIDAGIVSYG